MPVRPPTEPAQSIPPMFGGRYIGKGV